LRPNDNFRVVNDEDPVKKAALEDARRRYERNIENERIKNELLLKIHHENVRKVKEDNISASLRRQ
jgi:uncharacterized protein YaaW (UPF0174 family)